MNGVRRGRSFGAEYLPAPILHQALAASVRLNELLLMELGALVSRPRDEVYREALTGFSAALRRFVGLQVEIATAPGPEITIQLNEAADLLIIARRELDAAHIDLVNERMNTAYNSQLDTLAFIDQVQALAQAVGDLATEVGRSRNQVLGKLDQLLERELGG